MSYPQTVGAIELTAAELHQDDLVGVVNDGPQVTVTSLGQLAIFIQNYTGLARGSPVGVGAIELSATDLQVNDLIYIVNNGQRVTVTSLNELAIFVAAALTNTEGFVIGVGAIELSAAQLESDDLVYIVNNGPRVTVTSLGQLAIFIQGSATLINLGGFLVVSGLGLALWPKSSAGLLPGALWAEAEGGATSGFAVAVPVGSFVPGAPVFLFEITGAQLLVQGVAGLPLVDPKNPNQLWLNGGFVCISGG